MNMKFLIASILITVLIAGCTQQKSVADDKYICSDTEERVSDSSLCSGVYKEPSNETVIGTKVGVCFRYRKTHNCEVDPKDVYVSNFDINEDGFIDLEVPTEDNLQAFAEKYYDCEEGNIDCVKEICGCP